MTEGVPAGFRPSADWPAADFPFALGPLYRREPVDDDGAVYGMRAGAGIAETMLLALLHDRLGATARLLMGEGACATASLTCDFLAAAKPGSWLEIDCRRTRGMTRLLFMRGEVRVGGGKLMTAAGIWEPL